MDRPTGIAEERHERPKDDVFIRVLEFQQLQTEERRKALAMAGLNPNIAVRMAGGDGIEPTYMGFYHCRHFFISPLAAGLLYIAFWIDIEGKMSDTGLMFAGSAPAEAVFKAVEAVRSDDADMVAETSRLHAVYALAGPKELQWQPNR